MVIDKHARERRNRSSLRVLESLAPELSGARHGAGAVVGICDKNFSDE